jgi:hypothetical protein
MKSAYILLLTGCLTVLILDALGSIASRRLNFNYSRLAPLSFIVYTAIGFIGAREANQSTSIIIAAVTGLFDATIGWKISMLLKANIGEMDNNPSILRWISTALFVTLLAAICGLVGSELLRLTR